MTPVCYKLNWTPFHPFKATKKALQRSAFLLVRDNKGGFGSPAHRVAAQKQHGVLFLGRGLNVCSLSRTMRETALHRSALFVCRTLALFAKICYNDDRKAVNIMSRKKVKGLVSTIILGVCLLLALFFASRLLSVNLQEALEQMSQSAENSAGNFENAGEMELVYLLAASIGVLAATIAAYIIAIMTLISCAIPLIFSIRNIKVENKAIKIINIVYTVLFSSGVLLSLTKMLLFYLGVG